MTFSHQDGIVSSAGQVYFTPEELRCKGSGLLNLKEGFASALERFRTTWAKPMKVNSCCRSTAYNKKVGGAQKSYHICDDLRGGCCAIDIAITNAEERAAFVQLALQHGWSVGVNKSFIHIDRRNHHSPILFTY